MKINNLIVSVIFTFCIACNALAQSGFEKTYGGTKDDEAFYIQKTSDGGYIITGSTRSYPAKDQDIYILKIDSKGNASLNNSLGWANDDKGNCIQPTTDGGYIIAGSTQFNLDPNYFNNIHIKTNGTLTAIPWAKFVLAQTEGNHVFNSVQLTKDGNYIFAGVYNPRFIQKTTLLVKIDATTGDTIWVKGSKYKESVEDVGNSVIQTSDKGYLVGGHTAFILSSGMNDYQATLMKTDSMGKIMWHKEYGTTIGTTDKDYDLQTCKEVIPTQDGGFAMVGYSVQIKNGTLLPFMVYAVKTNSNGDTIWTKKISEGYKAGGNSIKQTTDGGYIITGYTQTTLGDSNVLLLRLDANGKKLWSKSFGGSKYDCGNSIQLTSDGGYIIAGTTASKGFGGKDAYLIKTGADGNAPVENLEMGANNFLISPNPSNGKFSILLSDIENKGELDIYDLNGKLMQSTTVMGLSFDLDLSSFPDGIYFAKLITSGKMSVKKLIIQR